MIRAQAMREHQHEVQEQLTRLKRALTVVWEKKVQDAWDQAESWASNSSQAKAWMKNARVQERRVRREKVAELRKQGRRTKRHQCVWAPQQQKTEERLVRLRLLSVSSAEESSALHTS